MMGSSTLVVSAQNDNEQSDSMEFDPPRHMLASSLPHRDLNSSVHETTCVFGTSAPAPWSLSHRQKRKRISNGGQTTSIAATLRLGIVIFTLWATFSIQVQCADTKTIAVVPTCFANPSLKDKTTRSMQKNNMIGTLLDGKGRIHYKPRTSNIYFSLRQRGAIRFPSIGALQAGANPVEAEEENDDFDESDAFFEGEFEGDEIVISTAQIRVLRKEADKRRVQKRLPFSFVPSEEQSNFSDDTLREINDLFVENELVEIRSISKNNKKKVHNVAERLSAELEGAQTGSLVGRMVIPIQIKGFSATFYCPFMEERSDRIQLRSSYRPNQWTRKLKPIRDERGQIILGEDGKSIKE